MKDLDIRPETIELPEENPEEKFSDANLSNDCSDMTTKVPAAEAKRDEWAYIKLKSFAEQTIHKMKRRSAEWEKVFYQHFSDKELISKELLQLSNKKHNRILEWAEELNRYFSKDAQMAHGYTKRCST